MDNKSKNRIKVLDEQRRRDRNRLLEIKKLHKKQGKILEQIKPIKGRKIKD